MRKQPVEDKPGVRSICISNAPNAGVEHLARNNSHLSKQVIGNSDRPIVSCTSTKRLTQSPLLTRTIMTRDVWRQGQRIMEVALRMVSKSELSWKVASPPQVV